jgi:general secretion pathway protein M
MDIRTHPIVSKMYQRYAELESRDQLALRLLVVFMGGLILFFGIWMPAISFYEARGAERDRQLSLIKYMRASEQEARALGGTSIGRPSGESVISFVSRSAQQYSINPNRLQPEGEGGASVWFDGVAFDDLVRWLQSLSESGYTVRQISIDREDEAGKVNARLVLRG